MRRCPNCGWPVELTAIYCINCGTKVQFEISKPTSRRYVGSNVGQYVLPLIERSSRSLFVVSPYISAKYARLLVDLAQRQVNVWVITSSEPNPKHQEALSVLRMDKGQGRKYFSGIGAALFVLAILTAIFSLVFSSIALLILGTLLAALGMILRKRSVPVRRAIPLHLKVTPQLIHAKMYIVDDKTLISGSANLTVAGMHFNVEQIEITDDPDRVSEAITSFRSLWVSA